MDTADIRIGRKWLPGRCLAALCLSVTLYGCGEDQYKGVNRKPMGGINIQQVQSESQILNRQPSPGPGGPPQPAVAAPPPRKLSPIEEHIRITRADLYYKFDWARSVLETKVVPQDLRLVVDDAKKRGGTFGGDRPGILIIEITKLLQDGLDAKELGDEFKRSGLDTDHIDWSAGRNALQKRSTSSSSEISDSKDSSDDTGRLRDILEYAEKHHSSPEQVMWEKFKLANQKTVELGKLLGLASDSSSVSKSEAPIGGGDLRNPTYLKKDYLND
jgi:hypothetical protein